ncbi:hypothetical protein Tco_1577774 [Tanacetum coccineum]
MLRLLYLHDEWTDDELQCTEGFTGVGSMMALPAQNINHSAFRSIFKREKLSGTNFNDWFCLLKLVLRVEKKLSGEGKRHTFRLYLNTSSKFRSDDFTLNEVLDEVVDVDGTIELPKDLPGTPPSLESANLEDA